MNNRLQKRLSESTPKNSANKSTKFELAVRRAVRKELAILKEALLEEVTSMLVEQTKLLRESVKQAQPKQSAPAKRPSSAVMRDLMMEDTPSEKPKKFVPHNLTESLSGLVDEFTEEQIQNNQGGIPSVLDTVDDDFLKQFGL